MYNQLMIPLRTLILEDQPADAELVLLELRKAGFSPTWKRVDNEQDYLTLLNPDLDLIVADYSLPQFNAHQALNILNEKGLDIPFIVVTGAVEEEIMVECIKDGAADYLLKDRLTRLGQAVKRALEEKLLREEKRRTEGALRQEREFVTRIIETSPVGIVVIDIDDNFTFANNQAEQVLGLERDGVTGLYRPPVWTFTYYDGRPVPDEELPIKKIFSTCKPIYDTPIAIEFPDGRRILLVSSASPLFNNDGLLDGVVATVENVTERIRSEEKFRALFEQAPDALLIESMDEAILDANPAACELHGYSRDELLQKTMRDLASFDPGDEHKVVQADLLKGAVIETTNRHRDGHSLPVEIRMGKLTTAGGDLVLAIVRDITARKKAEAQIQRQMQRIASLRVVDMSITASIDLRLTLKVIVDQVINQLNADAADILLLNPFTEALEYATGRGFYTSTIREINQRLDRGFAGQAALDRQLVFIQNLHEIDNPFPSSEGFVTYFGIPLVAKGNVKGVLEIFQRNVLSPEPDWMDFLESMAGQAAIAIDNASMFEDLQQANSRLLTSYDATIEGWARALELRDQETEGHSQRVTDLTIKIAQAMGLRELVHIRRGAILHDIGKMGIPDNILLKPGSLTPEEWEVMRKHTIYAYNFLSPIEFLRPALEIPYNHHEKWDGSGYPRGLKSEQIPLPARIFAVADVWDALRSDRPYRKAWTEEKALEYIREQTGRHFDPAIVDVFLKLLDR